MTTEIIKFNDEDKDVLKKTICQGLTDAEFFLFLKVCISSGLNPMLKQIYAIKAGGKMIPLVSIDGLRLIAERTGKYSPGSETLYTYDEKVLRSATASIKKMTGDGTWHDVKSTAFMSEYKGTTPPWTKMPHVMLAKCAESAALRKAFPNELSGLYSKEEMDQEKDIESQAELAEVEKVIEKSKLSEEQIKILTDLGEKNPKVRDNFFKYHKADSFSHPNIPLEKYEDMKKILSWVNE